MITTWLCGPGKPHTIHCFQREHAVRGEVCQNCGMLVRDELIEQHGLLKARILAVSDDPRSTAVAASAGASGLPVTTGWPGLITDAVKTPHEVPETKPTSRLR